MPLSFDLTMLLLSAVCVAEADGKPMTGSDIAFLLGLPREEIDACLGGLVTDGSIKVEGDLYRMSRSLTAPQIAEMEELSDRIQEASRRQTHNAARQLNCSHSRARFIHPYHVEV